MKLHLITIGEPKLDYAQIGLKEYTGRLSRFHQLRVTHLQNKYANDGAAIQQAIGNAYAVVMEITGKQLSSEDLAAFLDKRALEGREVCFVIGGPDGLPQDIIAASEYQLSLSPLTLPHDLAMVVTAEALYRASSINSGHPYHRA